MKLVSINVNGLRSRLHQLAALVEKSSAISCPGQGVVLRGFPLAVAIL